jgi:hypothetical protein
MTPGTLIGGRFRILEIAGRGGIAEESAPVLRLLALAQRLGGAC